MITLFFLATLILPPAVLGGAGVTIEKGYKTWTTFTTVEPISAGGGEFRHSWRLLSLGGPIPMDFTLIYAPDLIWKNPYDDGRMQFPPSSGIFSFTSDTIIRVMEFEDQNVTPAESYINVFVSDDMLVFKDDGTGNFVHQGPEKYQIKQVGDYYYFMDPLRELVYIFRSRTLNWEYPNNRLLRRAGEVVYITDRNNNTLILHL